MSTVFASDNCTRDRGNFYSACSVVLCRGMEPQLVVTTILNYTFWDSYSKSWVSLKSGFASKMGRQGVIPVPHIDILGWVSSQPWE